MPEAAPCGIVRATIVMLSGPGLAADMTFVIFAAYGVFAAYLRSHIVSNPIVQRWMRRGFAAAFGALAIQLALATR